MSEVITTTLPPLRDLPLGALGAPGDTPARLDVFLAGTEDEAGEIWFGGAWSRLRQETVHLRLLIDRDIARLDAAICAQINAILHHANFKALESAWRSIYWLAGSLGPDELTQLRVLDCSWPELARDLERSPEFDLSVTFDKIYNQEFGTPGGTPYSLLVGLYDIRARPSRDRPVDDIAVLRQLGAVAAAAFAPVILSASAEMLGVDKFGGLDRRLSAAALFRTTEYSRFNALRETPETRFLGLACPGVLMRKPYVGRASGNCGFAFDEQIMDADRDLLWGHAGIALAQVSLRAFEDYRWLAAIRGVIQDEEAGGVVVDLPRVDFGVDAPDTVWQYPLQVNFTEAMERELADAGLISIRKCPYTPHVAFNVLPSLNRPKGAYQLDTANQNERMSSMLNYVLCVSRFAHYVKVIARDWVGSYMSPEECQTRLNRWLSTYCTSGEGLSFELRARYPLASADVQVRAAPGQPGAYECVMLLKPHLQLDQANAEFQLVTTVHGVEKAL